MISNYEIIESSDSDSSYANVIATRLTQPTNDFNVQSMQAGVNIANGRLLLSHNDLSIGENSYHMGINHIYDSFGLTDKILSNKGIIKNHPKNWKLNIEMYLFKYETKFGLTDYGTNDYLFIDKDGIYHQMVKIQNEERYYDKSKTGIIMTKGANNTFELTSDSLEILVFDSSGRLIELKRKLRSYYHSKKIKYENNRISQVYDERHEKNNSIKRVLNFNYSLDNRLCSISIINNYKEIGIVHYSYTDDKLKFIVNYINQKEMIVNCFRYDSKTRLIGCTTTNGSNALEFEYNNYDQIQNVKKGRAQVILSKNSEDDVILDKTVISENDFFTSVFEGTNLLDVEIKNILDSETIERANYSYTLDFNSTNPLKTIVKNKKGIVFEYQLNTLGEEVSVLEVLDSNTFKTLTKDSGLLLTPKKNGINSFNNTQILTALAYQNEVSLDSAKIKEYFTTCNECLGDNDEDIIENYVLSFWVRLNTRVNDGFFVYPIFETKEKVDNGIHPDEYIVRNTPSTKIYIDHKAYKSWQYVTIPINMSGITTNLTQSKIKFCYNSLVSFDYTNIRIAPGVIEQHIFKEDKEDDLAISVTSASSLILYHLDKSFEEITLHNDNLDVINTTKFITERDILKYVDNLRKNKYDFYYNDLSKIIPNVKSVKVKLKDNLFREIKIDETNQSSPIVYRVMNSNSSSKTFKESFFLSVGTKEITTVVLDGSKYIKSESYTIYDDVNNILESKDSNEIETYYTYDNYSNLTSKSIKRNQEIYRENYYYDENGEKVINAYINNVYDDSDKPYVADFNEDYSSQPNYIINNKVKTKYEYDQRRRLTKAYNDTIKDAYSEIEYYDNNLIKSVTDSKKYKYEFTYDNFHNISKYSLVVSGNQKPLLEKKQDPLNYINEIGRFSSYNFQTGCKTVVEKDRYERIISDTTYSGLGGYIEEKVLFKYQEDNSKLNQHSFSPEFCESQSISKISQIEDGHEGVVYKYLYDSDNNLVGYQKLKNDERIFEIKRDKVGDVEYKVNGFDDFKTSNDYEDNNIIDPRVKSTKYNQSEHSMCLEYEYDDPLGRITTIKNNNIITPDQRFTTTLSYTNDGKVTNNLVSKTHDIIVAGGYRPFYSTSNYYVKHDNHNRIKNHVEYRVVSVKDDGNYYNVVTAKRFGTSYSYDDLNRIKTKSVYLINDDFSTDLDQTSNKTVVSANYYTYLNDNNEDINKITKIGSLNSNDIIKFEYDDLRRFKTKKLLVPGVNVGGIIDYSKYNETVLIKYNYSDYLIPTSIEKNNITYNLEWKRNNLLTRFGNAYYSYDHKGVKYKKVFNNKTTLYYYDGDKIICEDRGDIKIRYTYGLHGIIGCVVYGYGLPRYYRYVFDTQNNVRFIVSDQRIVAEYNYDLFGNCEVINISKGKDEVVPGLVNATDDNFGEINPIRWKGYYYDTDTGNYYANKRHYDPQVGLYIDSQDVEYVYENIGIVGGLDMYSLTRNNILSFQGNHNNILTSDDLKEDRSLIKDTRSWFKKNFLNILFVSIIVVGMLLLFIPGTQCFALGMFKAGIMSGFSNVLIGGAFTGIASMLNGGSFSAGFTKNRIEKNFMSGFVTGALMYAVGVALTGRCSNCFVAGTLVAIENGQKPIEEVEVGDKVYAYDEESGKKTLKKVVRLFRNSTIQLTSVNIDGVEPILCTPEHPFYILNAEDTPIVEFEGRDSSDYQGEWVTAGNLKAGHIVLLSNGKNGIINSVETEELYDPVATYNFEVEDYHTYYVGSEGILVHNACGTDAIDDGIKMDIQGSGKYGSYDITFESGTHYIGKGGQGRMWTSAVEKASLYDDAVVAVKWQSAVSNRAAFTQEAQWMLAASKANIPLYNKIASPGFGYMGIPWIR